MIIPICPFCNKPLKSEIASDDGHMLRCYGDDGHFYGAHANTEAEAHAIVMKPQKKLVEALSGQMFENIKANAMEDTLNKILEHQAETIVLEKRWDNDRGRFVFTQRLRNAIKDE